MKKYLTPEQIKMVLDAFEKMVGRKTLLIDLDGVVANFDELAEKWGAKIGMTGPEFIHNKLYRQPNFYFELELMPGAKEAILEGKKKVKKEDK